MNSAVLFWRVAVGALTLLGAVWLSASLPERSMPLSEWIIGFILCGVWSFAGTMLVLGIPWWIVLNLITTDRRHRLWLQTAGLFLVLCLLAGFFYGLYHFENGL